MRTFDSPTSRQIDAGLAILRTVAGVIFAAHGAQKLFVYGIAGVSGAFAGMGVPMPNVMGPAVGALEFLGGIALIIGLFTRPLAALLVANMLGAIFLVHLSAGFFAPKGYEFALALAAMAATLAITGAGSLSLDARIAARSSAGRAANEGHGRNASPSTAQTSTERQFA